MQEQLPSYEAIASTLVLIIKRLLHFVRNDEYYISFETASLKLLTTLMRFIDANTDQACN